MIDHVSVRPMGSQLGFESTFSLEFTMKSHDSCLIVSDEEMISHSLKLMVGGFVRRFSGGCEANPVPI